MVLLDEHYDYELIKEQCKWRSGNWEMNGEERVQGKGVEWRHEQRSASPACHHVVFVISVHFLSFQLPDKWAPPPPSPPYFILTSFLPLVCFLPLCISLPNSHPNHLSLFSSPPPSSFLFFFLILQSHLQIVSLLCLTCKTTCIYFFLPTNTT